MSMIHHIVAVRVPDLFCQTVCGLEFSDFGIPVGCVVRKPIPTEVPVDMTKETYSLMLDNTTDCVVCYE